MGHREHPIALAGPARADRTAPPALLAFDETDFVAALDARLLSGLWPKQGWPSAFASQALGADGATPRLYQPVHRRFSLAVVDAHCAQFGAPRLDPRKIEGSGLVLRRFVGPQRPSAEDLAEPRHWQGWMGIEDDPLGWVGFAAATIDADPAASTAQAAQTGSAAVDRLLAAHARRIKSTERVVPMWTVKPEIAQAAGRTLLFGLIPTATPVSQREPESEQNREFAALRAAGSSERNRLREYLSSWFKKSVATVPPRAGGSFDRSWLTQTRIPDDEDEFIAFIEQLAHELDAFGANAARWQPLLARFALWRHNPLAISAWPYERIEPLSFFAACARIVRPELGAQSSVTMPHRIGPVPAWVGLSGQPDVAQLVEQAVDAAADGFEAQAKAAPPVRGPFDDDARYAVRAFIRVKHDDPRCPSRLIWSEPSKLFTIAPWFETTGRKPAPIPLPKLDRATLAKLKPSTGFSLPAEVRRLIQPNGAQAMLAGNPRRAGAAIEWVLQLSMPIMTVCALVAMTVVLTLLDIVFRWIPFAWILIPRLRR